MTEKERAKARLRQLIERIEKYKPQPLHEGPQHMENPQPVRDGTYCEENEARTEEQLHRSAAAHAEQHKPEVSEHSKQTSKIKETGV